MRQRCLTLEGQIGQAGDDLWATQKRRHLQEATVAPGWEQASAACSLCPFSGFLCSSSSLQAKETLCCFLPQEPGGH